ncbi:MAG TPA: lytic transglycosylase domain-containing protein [Candidatus Limnocylindria bacterium]|nr:lytic transglycosylase domain-containing protein [Candidatus Limnocylindria bacterium]
MRRRSLIAILLLILVCLGAYLEWIQYRDHRYDRIIRAAAEQNHLPPALVKAVIWKESRFRPDAHGTSGELGLMQLREDAAQKWADACHLRDFVHEHILDPRTNTLAGCYYLAHVLRRYGQTDNPVAFALADYNAGRGNVLRWMGSTNFPAARTNSRAFLLAMTFPGTRSYVTEIMARRPGYEDDFPAEQEPAFR